jgi:hypothetical protein
MESGQHIIFQNKGKQVNTDNLEIVYYDNDVNTQYICIKLNRSLFSARRAKILSRNKH